MPTLASKRIANVTNGFPRIYISKSNRLLTWLSFFKLGPYEKD